MLTLSMIVKDEAHCIESTLLSVRPFFDAWVICDTGSTDGTPEVVERVMGRSDFGRLYRIRFDNFAQARNEALDFAETLASGVWPIRYVLTLDAGDHLYGGKELHTALEAEADRAILQGKSRTLQGLAKSSSGEAERLIAPAFFLEMVSGPYSWDTCRLVRAGAGWRWRGEVHEVLCGPNGERPAARIPGVRIGHLADERGQARSRARWERDVTILRAEADRNPVGSPERARCVFYLGLALAGLERWREAWSVFQERIVLGGPHEGEMFNARFRMAECAFEVDPYEGETLLGTAAFYHPDRAEPLWRLETIARERGHVREADEIRARRLKIPKPVGGLFVDERAYGRTK